MTKVTEPFDKLPKDSAMYYVRSSELEEVAITFFEANERVSKDWHCYNKYLTKKDFGKYITTYVDQHLHGKGHYLSEYLKDW